MKLRLLVTPYCNRDCDLCCNQNFDLDALPVITQADQFSKYTEISLTGGEPLLVYDKVRETILYIREYGNFKGPINLYTALPGNNMLPELMQVLDGLTISIHDKQSLVDVWSLYWQRHIPRADLKPNVRVKLAPKVHRYYNILEGLTDWTIEKFDWIVDCPLPEGEEFKRI